MILYRRAVWRKKKKTVFQKNISLITDAEDLVKASQSFCKEYENQEVKKGSHVSSATRTGLNYTKLI